MLYDAVDGVPEVNQFIQHVLFFFSALCWVSQGLQILVFKVIFKSSCSLILSCCRAYCKV